MIYLLIVSTLLLYWFNQYRLRKLSEAKLAISQSIIDLDKLLLERKYHTHRFYKSVLFIMTTVQSYKELPINWHKHNQMDANKELSRFFIRNRSMKHSPVTEFVHNYYKAFRWARPVSWILFVIYLSYNLLKYYLSSWSAFNNRVTNKDWNLSIFPEIYTAFIVSFNPTEKHFSQIVRKK